MTDNITAFSIGIATAFFGLYAWYLLHLPNRTRLHRIIGYIFIFRTVWMVKGLVATYPQWRSDDIINPLIIIDGWKTVTFFIFLIELVRPNWVTWRHALLLFAPFAVFSAAYFVWPSLPLLNAYVVFTVLYTVAVVVFSWRKALSITRYIRQNYSNIDDIDLSWLKYVLLLGVVGQLIWSGIIALDNISTDAFYYLLQVVLWLIILRNSLHRRPVSIELPQQQPAISAQHREYSFAGKLEQLVEKQAFYLNKDLTLTELASALKTNRTYLSDYFANVKHLTFYDYINQLRIEQMAVPLIQQHPEYTVEYIASESGFKSISTFRRAFAKHTGKSPSQFREELEL